MTTTSTDDRGALGQALTDALRTVLEAFIGSGGDPDLLGEVLVATGVLRPADLWAVPADPGEELAQLAALPDTGDEAELDRRLDEEGLLREALTRVGHVYLEGEPRPSCAPALYEIGGSGA